MAAATPKTPSDAQPTSENITYEATLNAAASASPEVCCSVWNAALSEALRRLGYYARRVNSPLSVRVPRSAGACCRQHAISSVLHASLFLFNLSTRSPPDPIRGYRLTMD